MAPKRCCPWIAGHTSFRSGSPKGSGTMLWQTPQRRRPMQLGMTTFQTGRDRTASATERQWRSPPCSATAPAPGNEDGCVWSSQIPGYLSLRRYTKMLSNVDRFALRHYTCGNWFIAIRSSEVSCEHAPFVVRIRQGFSVPIAIAEDRVAVVLEAFYPSFSLQAEQHTRPLNRGRPSARAIRAPVYKPNSIHAHRKRSRVHIRLTRGRQAATPRKQCLQDPSLFLPPQRDPIVLQNHQSSFLLFSPISTPISSSISLTVCTMIP